MAFERMKFGIEYNPRSMDGEASGIGCLVGAIAAVAVVSLGWAVFSRMRESARVKEAVAEAARQEVEQGQPEEPPKASIPQGLEPIRDTTPAERPNLVRNLLQRLEEAERRGDVEMAATTIEKIRSLPGQSAADLDDQLARRLGAFNMKRLFESKNPQWVADVKVKAGDAAMRIAREHGSTYASMVRLNGSVDMERLKVGQGLKVMANPRFTLVVRRRPRIADLELNGKFFARYDLVAEVKSEPGLFELGAKARQFFAAKGIEFSPESRRELEMLLPANAKVSVTEM